MSVALRQVIGRLKQQILSLCVEVEGQVEKAVRAVRSRDLELAEEVQRQDREVDLHEIEVEEDCLKMLALYQPVASDLRLVVSTLKINHDLEVIGDMAVNIARKVRGLQFEPPAELTSNLSMMAEKARRLLRDSIDSLVNLDVTEAASIRDRDDEVDQMKAIVRQEIEASIQAQPDEVGTLLRLLAVSRNLERVADLATTIAGEVIYLIQGRITRHSTSTQARSGDG